MKTNDFMFDLPPGQIAQDPLTDRSASRLLALQKDNGEISHHIFKDIISFLRPGDCLVRNNTKVIPARLYGVKEGSGARIELLLLKRIKDNTWETLVKPGKKAKVGTKICLGEGKLLGEVTGIGEDGSRWIQFTYQGVFEEVLDSIGSVPLPPYISHDLKDKNRYQTVYAEHNGSAAAPTAGLHFTEELLTQIETMDITIANVTLHVGLGTFRPVKTADVTNHHMHSEYYQILQEEADKINLCRKNGGRVICVGTTSCRTIESASDENGVLKAGEGYTDIFIYPGYSFKIMDALITNFHLPESTLLMLVSAFAGRENILHAYESAVAENYRFFSFGDAMLLY